MNKEKSRDDQIFAAIKDKLNDSEYMQTALTQVLNKVAAMTPEELHQATLEAMQNLIKMQNSIKKYI